MKDKISAFLKKETKSSIVLTSVLISIAVIALIIASIMVPGKYVLICSIGSAVLVLIAAIIIGIVQIKVFRDYKSQKKYICADGIFHICVSALIVIALSLFLFANASIDLRYIISVFIFAFVVWKIVTAVTAFKEKRNNAWLDIVISAFWLTSGILLILTAVMGGDLLLMLFAGSNFVLLIIQVIYMLYSYIFKTPAYLETPEAIEILNTEKAERKSRLDRYNIMAGRVTTQPEPQIQPKVEEKPADRVDSLQDKLAKLNKLKIDGIITEEEYKEKRKQIIDSSL